jgi:hypothetical protein
MKTASWVILTIVGALVLLGSLVSAWLAYGGNDYPIGTKPISEIAAAHEGVGVALRGIRGTSAAYAAGYALLFLSIVLGPYRRREVWSWWAILAGVTAIALITWLRVPSLGLRLGLGGAFIQFGIVLIGLLLDVGRVRTAR